MSLYRLRTPAGTAAPDGLALFRTAFPGIDADVNTLVQPAAGTRGWDAAGAVGWPEHRDTCGRGVSIGLIDTPVEAAHEAFQRSNLTQQSFVPEDRKPAPPGHGTAVAALLVGDPGSAGYGGLVPGATLYAGNIFEELDTGRVVGNLFALV